MLLSFALAAGIIAIIFACGYAIAVHLLKIRDTMTVVALASTAGLACYLFSMNALGYVIPIRLSFLVSLIILVVTAAGLCLLARQNGSRVIPKLSNHPPRHVVIVLLSIILLAGYAYARDRGSDEWVWTTYPMPATIIEGNFPIREPANPWELTNYHYAPQLWIAALSDLSGISLASAHSTLPLLSCLGIILSAAALAWRMSKSWNAVMLCSAMALFAAGLFWFQGIWLLRDLLYEYVLHRPLPVIADMTETAFRWLTPTVRNIPSQSLVALLGHRAVALGAAYLWAFFLCMQVLWEKKRPWKEMLPWMTLAVIFGAGLALTFEATLVLLLLALVIACEFLLPKKQWRVIGMCAIVAAAITVLSLTQGGPLTSRSGSVSPGSFSLNLTGALEIGVEGNVAEAIPVWTWRFIRDFGLHLLSLLAIAWWLARQKKTDPMLLTLFFLSVLTFAAPVLISYRPQPQNMLRIFQTAFTVSSFLIAFVLWKEISQMKNVKKRKNAKIAAGIFVGMLLMSGVLNTATRLVFPSLRLEWAELWPSMPPVSRELAAMHVWVKAHSTLEDRFYIREDFEEKDSEVRDWIYKYRMLFSGETGRFVIGYANINQLSTEHAANLRAIERFCATRALDAFAIRFLVIPRKEQALWFGNFCDKNAWKLVYGDARKTYPRVYERATLSP